MLTTTADYQRITRDLDRSLKLKASEPYVARETEYYLSRIGEIKTIDDFLADTRVFNYAMKALGLEEMSYAKAFMRKVLTEGIDDRNSFANKLIDKRYREFARTFNFHRYGEFATTFTRAQQGIVDNYIRQSLEIDAGQQNQGVRLALYFERKAETIDSPYAILADPALTKFIQVALRIPPMSSMQDIDKQAAEISKRLDLQDLKDPEKLDKLILQFTTLWELENPSRATAATVPNVLIGQPHQFGFSAELLASLQNLKRGGY